MKLRAKKATAVIQVNIDFSGGRRPNFLKEPPWELKTLDVALSGSDVCVQEEKSRTRTTAELPFRISANLWATFLRAEVPQKPVCNQKRGECSLVIWRCQSNRALPTAVFWKPLGFLRHSLIKTNHKYLLSRGCFHVCHFFNKFKHNKNPIFTSLEGKSELLKSRSCVQRARLPGFHHCTLVCRLCPPSGAASLEEAQKSGRLSTPLAAAVCGTCGSRVCAPLQVLLLSK